MTFIRGRDGTDGTDGTDRQTDRHTDRQTDIRTDRLFSGNIILDITIAFKLQTKVFRCNLAMKKLRVCQRSCVPIIRQFCKSFIFYFVLFGVLSIIEECRLFFVKVDPKVWVMKK